MVGRCPLCDLPDRRLKADSGLCRPCHLDIYPREKKGWPRKGGLQRLMNMRPENDYQIVDETGRLGWASDLVRRYVSETRPKGRISGGF